MLPKENQDTNHWDLLAKRFDTHKQHWDIHPDAAVNIYVGWPTFFAEIEKQKKHMDNKSLRIFDYGCGAGELCKILAQLGNDVTGYEQSEELRTIALRNIDAPVEILDSNELSQKIKSQEYYERFDVITSIHVFDWIQDLDEVITNLAKMLKKHGVMIFAVFPKEHIIDSIQIEDLFENIDSMENPTKCVANFDGIRVPVYIKDTRYYDTLFKDLGFEKVLETMPPYPEEFLNKYEWQGSLEPEMLILEYRKS